MCALLLHSAEQIGGCSAKIHLHKELADALLAMLTLNPLLCISNFHIVEDGL
jgi:hypothetical protein